MNEIKFQFPLQWLPQQPRTKRPERARFQTNSISRAGDMLADELRKLGASNCIISANLQIKIAGGFYANQKVEDAGVVVYFKLKDSDKAMACDKWDRAEHNLWALYLSITAIRGLERWGGSELLDGLFTGFKALPSPDQITTPSVRYFTGIHSIGEGKAIFKQLAMEFHPDQGGSQEDFMELNKQYLQFKQAMGIEDEKTLEPKEEEA